MNVLEAVDVGMRFGGVRALDAVSVTIRQGEIVALIGPNGAGKTTFLNCVSGLYQPQTGAISIEGRNVARLTPISRTRLGVGRTFQTPELFRRMTVEENLLVPLGIGPWWRGLPEALGTPAARRRERSHRRHAAAIVTAFGLEEHLHRPVGDLSLGHQRMIELARALAGQPRLLLLDEPGSGLDTQETVAFGELLISLRDELGFGALLVEHDMALVEQVSDQAYVLDFGTLLAVGSIDDVRRDPAVIAAYLGSNVDAPA